MSEERCSICNRTRAESFHATGYEPQLLLDSPMDSTDPRFLARHYWNGKRIEIS